MHSTRHQSSSGFVLSNQAWQKPGSHQVVRLEPTELMKENIQGLKSTYTGTSSRIYFRRLTDTQQYFFQAQPCLLGGVIIVAEGNAESFISRTAWVLSNYFFAAL